MIRCINIDWLECYCLEDALNYPHDAEYFRVHGWSVREREYGTPMYHEMFTLYDHHGEPFIEIRRRPKSCSKLGVGIFDPYSAHVRLSNRACYYDGAARLMAQFLEENGFAFRRIARIDICLDFFRFDYGDDPQRFIQRFMAGRYAKINQANISAHGLDQWDGRNWNSLSWGAKTSMISTKIYNKTMELRQVKDKPYIRQAWQMAGLVDDALTLEVLQRDGTKIKPDIWRLEFAIKSGTRGWFVMQDFNSSKRRLLSKRNTLDCYYTRRQLLDIFFSLAEHYFHFKVVEYLSPSKALAAEALAAITVDNLHQLADKTAAADRRLQRKDRCADKKLFRMDDASEFYKLERLATATPRDKNIDGLLVRLYAYRERQYEKSVRDACNVIIARLENIATLQQYTGGFTNDEVEILRRIIATRLHSNDVPYDIARSEAEALIKIEHEIWNVAVMESAQ